MDFYQPAMQAAYEDATRELQYDRLRFLYVVTAVLCLFYLIPDYLLFGGTPAWPEIRFWRLLTVALTAGAYGINNFRLLKMAPRYPLQIAFAATVFMMFVLARVAHAAGGFPSYYFPPIDIVFIVWGFFFVGGLRRLGAPAVAVLIAFLVFLVYLEGMPPAREFVGRSLILIVSLALCLWGGQVIETLRRREFARSWETSRRKETLETALLERDRTQERLLQLEGSATIGEYLASILHDLRNPVAGVRSVVEEVVSELKGADPVALQQSISSLESSLRQQQRAEEFIRALLVLSRRSQGYGETVDVNEAVAAVLQILRVQFKREKAQFAGQYGANLPSVRGNFSQLGQVLLNVGRNAAESLAGGEGRIVFETRAASGRIEIECRDSGPGIAEQALPKIFDLFFTTKSTGQAAGVGLYLAREIVQRHGGSMEARNSSEGGAVLTIRLPVAPEVDD